MEITDGWNGFTSKEDLNTPIEFEEGRKVKNNDTIGVIRKNGKDKIKDHGASWENQMWAVVTEDFRIVPLERGTLEYLD